MADNRIKFWFLYSGSALGRCYSRDWHVDDTQDMCLCVDGAYWFFCYETGNLKARLLIMIKL